MATDLDTIVEEFHHRPLDAAGPFTFVAADALTMKVREGGRVINAVVLLATGVNGDDHREVLGMRCLRWWGSCVLPEGACLTRGCPTRSMAWGVDSAPVEDEA